MAISGITFCGREQAEDMIPDPRVAIISITDPDAELCALRAGWMDVLRLQFRDIDPDRVSNPWTRADMLHSGKLMTRRQAAKAVAFVRGVEELGAIGLVVHCEAGVSRSAGVALWAADERQIYLPRNEVAEHNRWVYRLLLEESKGG